MNTCTVSIPEKQNVKEIHNFLPFENCAGRKQYFIKLNNFLPFCMPSYGKVIMQAIIEFVNSNSVIPEQQPKNRKEYTRKRLFLRLKIACHNACILKIYNRH